MMAVDCFVLKMGWKKMPGIRGPYDYWIQALTHVWELCGPSGSRSWQNDARGIRPCNKGRGTTHCLVTLSEAIWHAEVGTGSRYLPLLDKSRVFDKTMCGLGWLRWWNLSNSLAMWECGQPEERENTLGQSQSEYSAFFLMHWWCISDLKAHQQEPDREKTTEKWTNSWTIGGRELPFLACYDHWR